MPRLTRIAAGQIEVAVVIDNLSNSRNIISLDDVDGRLPPNTYSERTNQSKGKGTKGSTLVALQRMEERGWLEPVEYNRRWRITRFFHEDMAHRMRKYQVRCPSRNQKRDGLTAKACHSTNIDTIHYGANRRVKCKCNDCGHTFSAVEPAHRMPSQKKRYASQEKSRK